jgi:hypothetical protein
MNTVDIRSKIASSRSDFMEYVWPEIRRSFPKGEIVPIEGEGGDACQILDFAGIDYLFRPESGEPYGVSQRVLTGSWETLTLRPRELQRLRSVWGCPGALAPALLVQGYVNSRGRGEKVLDAAIILRTAALLCFVDAHPGQARTNQSGADFLWWSYDDLEDAGVCELRIPSSGLKDPLGLWSSPSSVAAKLEPMPTPSGIAG